MQQQDFADLLFDGVQRIERGHRFLEHDGDVVAAHPPHVVFPQAHQILPLEQDLPGWVPRRGIGEKPHDRERRDGLSRAGFADQRQRLPLADVEGDAVDGQHFAFAAAEGDGEVADGEEGGGGRIHSCRSSRNARISESTAPVSPRTFFPLATNGDSFFRKIAALSGSISMWTQRCPCKPERKSAGRRSTG